MFVMKVAPEQNVKGSFIREWKQDILSPSLLTAAESSNVLWLIVDWDWLCYCNKSALFVFIYLVNSSYFCGHLKIINKQKAAAVARDSESSKGKAILLFLYPAIIEMRFHISEVNDKSLIL